LETGLRVENAGLPHVLIRDSARHKDFSRAPGSVATFAVHHRFPLMRP
jgi:hypothetical protein